MIKCMNLLCEFFVCLALFLNFETWVFLICKLHCHCYACFFQLFDLLFIRSTLLSFRGMGDGQTTHILLCALALGWREIIPAGSPQSQPSSTLFHTGTDALADPSWHVIWESSAGTRVLPLFMVTFRLNQHNKRPDPQLEKASKPKVQKALQE